VSSRLDELVFPVSSDDDMNLGVCRLANQSSCAITTSVNKTSEKIVVVLYNGQGHLLESQQVTVYLSNEVVSGRNSISVSSVDLNGYKRSIDSEIIPTASKNNLKGIAPYSLVFRAEDIPPLFFSRYIVSVDSAIDNNTDFGSEQEEGNKAAKRNVLIEKVKTSSRSAAPPPLVVSSDTLSLSFTNGLLTEMTRLDTGIVLALSNEYTYRHTVFHNFIY
jgi:hypothetical protein